MSSIVEVASIVRRWIIKIKWDDNDFFLMTKLQLQAAYFYLQFKMSGLTDVSISEFQDLGSCLSNYWYDTGIVFNFFWGGFGI